MTFKEKIRTMLGVTEKEYEKALAKNEYERAKNMAQNLGWNDPRGIYSAERDEYTITQAQVQRLAAQQNALRNQYQQQLQMANAAGNGVFGQYAQQATENFRQTIGSTPKGRTPTFEQLEDPDSPFNLSLEALSVMWGARFGYRWVKDEDTADAVEENEEMWSTVCDRLIEAGLLVRQQYRHPDSRRGGTAWKLVEKDHGNS